MTTDCRIAKHVRLNEIATRVDADAGVPQHWAAHAHPRSTGARNVHEIRRMTRVHAAALLVRPVAAADVRVVDPLGRRVEIFERRRARHVIYKRVQLVAAREERRYTLEFGKRLHQLTFAAVLLSLHVCVRGGNRQRRQVPRERERVRVRVRAARVFAHLCESMA